MQEAIKNPIQTQRPKLKRVYVRLTNAENTKETKQFTAYGVTMKDIENILLMRDPVPNKAA